MASVQLGKKYVDDISTIVGVQFGILSPEEIVRRSAVNITESTFYDSNGEPKINGLFDPRMGVIERGKLCKTCEQTYIPCPGHFGHIELAKPVFYIQFINQIQELMKCVCIRCSKLLLDMNDTSIKAIIKMKKSDEFLNLLSSKVKTKVCGQFPNMDSETASSHGCGAIQPNKYITKELDYIVGEWQRDVADDAGDKKRELVQQRFTPEMVLSIFKRISIDDARILGFSPDWCLPHWMICVVLPVVPPAVRPSVRQYNNQRSEDDLTQKYNDIIKHNDMIKKKLVNKDISEDQINGYVHLLQYDIATLIDNDGSKNIPPSMTKGGRQIKAFKQRLNGKDGRVRNNLMGKRVDFSARSVISPDSNLNIEELGVPLQIAMNLTVPEIVNKYNIDRVYQFVRNGANVHPGAKSYKKAEDGRVRNLEYMDTSKIVLNYGDIVNRHMMDGDPVLFNRQPSLHKMSAMSHQARVMDRLSFGLNINVCEPYNADFDGDEMNLHVPQSIQATMELKYLPAVSKQIISPSYNTPIIKPAQDNLLGLYKITDDSVYFNQRDMMNLLMDVVGFDGRLPEPAIKDTRILWTGKQLVSIILPPISMKKGKVIIEKGIIKQGQINKGASNEIVHIIFSDYGHLANQRYLNNLQKIVIRYMIRSGYSVGISDLLVHADIRKRNEETIVKGKQAVADITRKIHLNTFEDISHDISEVFEGEISAIIGKTSKAIEDNTVNLISDGNRVKYMVDAGTKGKMTNFTMMCCLVDQQSIDNKRISLGFSNRSLPHFTKYDNGMDSKGYISHNYLEGLTPQEFYFHAMAGREGLIDTAVKTARSGYLQRKLIKATEDLKVQHDYTVRNSNGDIVQFLYGDDGFNSIHLENMTFKNIFLISQADLDSLILLKSDDDWKSYLTAGILEVLRKTSKVVSQRFKEYNDYVMGKLTGLHETYKKYLKAGKGLDSIKLYFPINFDRIIGDTMKKYNLDKTNKSDLNPIYIIDAFDSLVKRCVCHGKTNDLMELLIIDYLSVPRIIKELRLTKIAFDHLIIAIEARFKKSLVQGGEMVGPLAAQSIGEVSTQLTLRTFHAAGNAAASSVNQGVPRLDELLNKQTPKKTQLQIYLTDEHNETEEKADEIRYNLELVKMSDILLSDAIYAEPSNNINDVMEEDRAIMKLYEVFSELDPKFKQIPNNPWIIRLEFNRREMINKKITMEDINLIIQHNMPNANIVFTDDNAGKMIFRIRLNFDSNTANADDDISLLVKEIEKIKNITIKGIDGIQNVFCQKNVNRIVMADGLYKTVPEYYLLTNGSNLMEVLTKPYVDSMRTSTIDVIEAYHVLGVEAARWLLENQFHEVFGSTDKFVSPRHIGLVCDLMTSKGKIMAANRNGINNSDIGPFAKISFEETIRQLKEAGLFGKYDHMVGVSSNIMFGQIPSCGTGDSEILLDEQIIADYIKEHPTLLEPTAPEDSGVSIESAFGTDGYCDENQDINFNFSSIEGDCVDLGDLPSVRDRL